MVGIRRQKNLYALYVAENDEFKFSNEIEEPVGHILKTFGDRTAAIDMMETLFIVNDAFMKHPVTFYVYDVYRKKVIA